MEKETTSSTTLPVYQASCNAQISSIPHSRGGKKGKVDKNKSTYKSKIQNMQENQTRLRRRRQSAFSKQTQDQNPEAI